MTNEVEKYFQEKYKESKINVVPGHWPDFESKQEVDEWIDFISGISDCAEEKQHELEMLDLKKEYNEYLKRHIKAVAYLDDNNVPIPEREKWLPEYKKILHNLNRVVNILNTYNVDYTADEIFGGFDLSES